MISYWNFAGLWLTLAVARVQANAQIDTQSPLGYQANVTDTCHQACASLTSLLGEKVYYQNLPPELFKDYYSGQQQDIVPLCLVLPSTAEDVSDVMKVIGQHECIFAVKSGGHAMFAGSSNAPGGITLDMRNLNSLNISEDQQTLSVGTGNRWGAVYKYLDPMNLTVVGGRDNEVGVGGFLLGGGISFIGRRFGWGSDNVRNYELVLANGSISDINFSRHPDLYWALRGGGGNFGIVTRFDLEVHQQKLMWGGFSLSLFSDFSSRRTFLSISRPWHLTVPSVLEKTGSAINALGCLFGYCTTIPKFAVSMENLTIEAMSDPYAQAYGVIVCLPYTRQYVLSTQLNHGAGLDKSPSFGELQKSKKVATWNRLTRPSDLSQDISDFQYGKGDRNIYETATLKVNSTLIQDIVDIFISEIEPARHFKGFGGSYVMQIITKDEISHMSKNGGNCLGLKVEDAPLLLLSVALTWKDKAHDEFLFKTSRNIIDRSVVLAKERGLWHPFIYQNYAADGQDVFGGYPPENRKRLKEIRAKYDPAGIFERLKPGYHQL